MSGKFNCNFGGYFRLCYRMVGNRFFISLLLGVLVSFWDSIGLVMFMPLMESICAEGGMAGGQDLGYLHFVTDFSRHIGVPLAANMILLTLTLLFSVKGIFRFRQLS